MDFSSLECLDWPQAVVINTTTPCGPELGSKSFELDVTFDTSETTKKALITSCFEESVTKTVWTRHQIPRAIGMKVHWSGSMPFQGKESL